MEPRHLELLIALCCIAAGIAVVLGLVGDS